VRITRGGAFKLEKLVEVVGQCSDGQVLGKLIPSTMITGLEKIAPLVAN
jgi:hypothetical protein